MSFLPQEEYDRFEKVKLCDSQNSPIRDRFLCVSHSTHSTFTASVLNGIKKKQPIIPLQKLKPDVECD